MGFLLDCLYWLMEWAGFDYEKMSSARLVAAVTLGTVFAAAMVGGGVLFLAPRHDTVSTLIGIGLLLFGLGMLGWIAINLRAALRKRRETA